MYMEQAPADHVYPRAFGVIPEPAADLVLPQAAAARPEPVAGHLFPAVTALMPEAVASDPVPPPYVPRPPPGVLFCTDFIMATFMKCNLGSNVMYWGR